MQILDIGSAAVAAALFIGLLTVTPPPSDIGWSYPSIIVIGGLAILAVACWRTGPYRVRALIWSNPGLKVVYMSGYSEDLVARHGTLTSRVALLRKPFDIEQVALKLRAVLDEPTTKRSQSG